jgi:hypothetical protein
MDGSRSSDRGEGNQAQGGEGVEGAQGGSETDAGGDGVDGAMAIHLLQQADGAAVDGDRARTGCWFPQLWDAVEQRGCSDRLSRALVVVQVERDERRIVDGRRPGLEGERGVRQGPRHERERFGANLPAERGTHRPAADDLHLAGPAPLAQMDAAGLLGALHEPEQPLHPQAG